ncbi:hypothetical protein COCCU_12790 [Corynebacterium occultum]|uniref:Uncharacterized protein n=1 Tax=Corynebacterium occultum TaxID=2675219 RepID=A0A6B8WQC4_9CORY|nr:hypothetical protein [Corynebacterium occultum]QGU08458.1 hypothetical protein COCCU_12790 [Corynebacterium occultum]
MKHATNISRISTRTALVLGLILAVALGGTGLATAEWIIKDTVHSSVEAGTLSTGISGTVALGNTEINNHDFTRPVALTLHNPNPVPVSYSLELDPLAGNLDPTQFELAVWESLSPICSDTIPPIGIYSGTFTDSLELSAVTALPESDTTVCAATRFTGPLASIDKGTLIMKPNLTAHLGTSAWTAVAAGDEFTHTISTPIASPPLPVSNLQCTDVGDHPHNSGVELSWMPVSGATSYQVFDRRGQLLQETMLNSVFLDEYSGGKHNPDITQVEVVALNAQGNSTPTRQNIFLAQGGGMGNHLRCGL